MVITKKKILKTAFLPEYLPRLKNLFGSGFGNLAFLIAIVYNTVRILPNNHPYLHPDKKGQYNIRQVIAEAADHISLKKENIDQILVFFLIIAALIILLIQFCLLAFAVVIPKSYAQEIPSNILDFFVTPNPQEDIAFQLLNLVFGIPDFFEGGADVQEPIHVALHSLFEFYSLGIMIVGTFIILYMAVTTVAETAQSGIPFGRRFNKAWTPIRIVLFFALLLPITLGLNSAQYITLLSAKLGSGLASQGWILYNEVLAQNNFRPTGTDEQNVAIPKKENLMHIPAFMMVVRTCAYSYEANYSPEVFTAPSWADGIVAWAVYKTDQNDWASTEMEGTTYENLIVESKARDIHIVFGVKDPDLYKEFRADIAPICGSLVLKVTDASQPGAAVFRQTYYQMIADMWGGARDINLYAQEYSRLASSIFTVQGIVEPDTEYKKEWQAYFDELMEGADGNGGVIQQAVDAQINGDWQVSKEMRDLGWAGAGIWYNKVAEQNGALIAALRNSPMPMLYPRVMERIEKSNRSENINANPLDRFTISFAAETPDIFVTAYEKEISRALNYVYKYWNENDSGDNPVLPKTGNAFIDIVNTVLGTQGLFELCRNTDIHPLAQLSAVGKSMLDNSIRAFGGSVLFGLFGVQPLFQQTTGAISSFFGTIANVGLLIGFILFYVLPFMPFIYFFFAVGSWVKTIFEAMVGVPLWALAHLRIDGEGVMGDAAMSGYYLVFEIFIRPILIIFGLIASIVIFAAMVKALNQIYYLVVSNASGHDPKSFTVCFQDPAVQAAQVVDTAYQEGQLKEAYRGPLDEFFFTIMYTIVVYMIGTSCFKLIDSIPDNMLRWMDADTSSFGDNAGDDAAGLMKYVTLGGSQFGSQIGESLQGLGKGATQTARDGLASLALDEN